MHSHPSPVQKHVLLLGAGNAHLRFVRMAGMRPDELRGVAVTLVSEAPTIPYSAMVPGHVAGDYRRDQIEIDLVRLCRSVGVRFTRARAVALDAAGRRAHFDGRPELAYDAVSLGLGSLPARPEGMAFHESSWPMRPLSGLLDRVDELAARLASSPGPFHLAVVGGGASGCELALAIRKRFAACPGFRLTLCQSHDRLLPGLSAGAARRFDALLKSAGVAVRLSSRVTGGTGDGLVLDGRDRLPCDAVLWATDAAPPELLRTSGLPLDDAGFLLVGDTLQSPGDPAVFGTGDCVGIEGRPGLLKNGVLAVRQGGVLFDNVGRFLRERPLRRFVPQKRCLCLMNASDGTAVLSYGPFAWRGRAVRWLKDRIDRRWMEGFTRSAPMAKAGEETPAMRCGGCGNKVSGDVLSAVVSRLDVGDDARVLLGTRAGEDASVHRVRPELFGPDPSRLVEVQTVDYFKAFVDDPYLFGRVAALNAVSDCYAMNARPFAALAIATLPVARGPVQEAMLYELLSGAVESLKSMGVVLTGGHTTEGAELALGFAVTGYAEEDGLFRKGGLVVGDRLVLTKPLGSGALLAAWMRGECKAGWFAALTRRMLNGNDRVPAVLSRHGVRAATDVTGFGLAGHLLEMLDASGVSARLDAAKVPVYEGFAEVVASGVVSTLHADNAKSACRVLGEPPAWLFDPQTSGGMLAGVAAAEAEAVVAELIAAGYAEAAVVGEVVAARGRPAVALG